MWFEHDNPDGIRCVHFKGKIMFERKSGPSGNFRGLCGFTVVELLVVISIVALLLSMILPSLQQMREMARRLQCASNQRQLYSAAVRYADDFKDRLPNRTAPSGSDGIQGNGYIYWEVSVANGGYWRNYINDYCSDPKFTVGTGTTSTGLYGQAPYVGAFAPGVQALKSIGFCPSAHVELKSGDSCWDHRGSYSFKAWGMNANPGQDGSTRTSFLGPGPLGPKLFSMDVAFDSNPFTWKTTNYQASYGNSHDYAGANVMDGGGSCVWISYTNMLSESWFGVESYMYPPTYYVPPAWYSYAANQQTLHYPNQGTLFGAATYNSQNKQLYGY